MKQKIILNDVSEIIDDFKKIIPTLENKSILITGGSS